MSIYFLIISPFVGSFLGLLVHRLPTGHAVAWERSKCDHCGVVLLPWQLIPVFSFLFQHGRSACCNKGIPSLYFWIEILATLIAVACVLLFPLTHAILGMILGWGLLTLSFIDARVFRLPDVITMPLLILGLLATAWFDNTAFLNHVIAAVFGWSLFLLVKYIYGKYRGYDGLGEGDAKLMAVGGAWLGIYSISPILLISCLVAFSWIATKKIMKQPVSLKTKLPYGVFLSIAIFGIWLFRPWMITWVPYFNQL